MQIVILRLGISDLLGRHLKQTSWLSMLLPGGIVHQNCSLIVLNTLQQLIFGRWVAYLVKSWPGNHCFLAEIMFISWDLSQRYALQKLLSWTYCVTSFRDKEEDDFGVTNSPFLSFLREVLQNLGFVVFLEGEVSVSFITFGSILRLLCFPFSLKSL